jgi:hypothetical protein
MDIPKRSSNFSQFNREPSNKTNEQKINIITNCMNLGKKKDLTIHLQGGKNSFKCNTGRFTLSRFLLWQIS